MTLQYYLDEGVKAAGVEFKPPRECDAGFDLPAARSVSIPPGARELISTGLHLSIPQGCVGIIKDRSSVAFKRGGHVLAGVIDSSYRGEVKVLMLNTGSDAIEFELGERVAQLLIIRYEAGLSCQEVDTLEALGATERQAGGFGSTGQ